MGVAAPCHFVPSDEEGTHALADVEVDPAESRPTRPMAEIVRPAAQNAVQRVAHFPPRGLVAWHQQVTPLRLEPLHALLGRACAPIPLAVPPVRRVRAEPGPLKDSAVQMAVLERSVCFLHRSP